MANQHEKDVEALQALDELKSLKNELSQVSDKLAKLAQALRNPTKWRIKSEAPLGYGENSATDVQLPDLAALGEKVHEYQKKHYNLSIRLSSLSPSVRKTIQSEIDSL
jgi:hypothetical protein